MLPTFPSRTALGAAMRRAAHQLFDRPLVLDDPLACPILGAEVVRHVASERARHDEPRARQLRALLVARSRHAEDGLAAAHARGVRQYVLLGAGLDTSALRATLPELRSFEVDQPATQAAKRARVEQAGIAVPPRLAFAPIDLETEPLDGGLARAGFDRAAPAFVSWLGVVPYLTRDAIAATLGFVAGLAAGTELVFDFARPSAAAGPLAARVAAAGEPLRSFFEPDELVELLRGIGFRRADVLDHTALDERYFAGRADGLRLETTGQLVHARVGA